MVKYYWEDEDLRGILMGSSSLDIVTPENFGHAFLHGNPEIIYSQCNIEFKQLIKLSDCRKLTGQYHENSMKSDIKM